MANNVKDELSHELKVQELQENLRKAEKMGMEDLSPELKSSVEELKQAAQDVTRPYATDKSKATDSEPSSQVTESSETMKPAESESPEKDLNKADYQPLSICISKVIALVVTYFIRGFHAVRRTDTAFD